MRISDWSSDVCSSDLLHQARRPGRIRRRGPRFLHRHAARRAQGCTRVNDAAHIDARGRRGFLAVIDGQAGTRKLSRPHEALRALWLESSRLEGLANVLASGRPLSPQQWDILWAVRRTIEDATDALKLAAHDAR